MLIKDIIEREYKLCDFEEREKSVIYKEVDIDNLMLIDSKIDEDNIIEIIDPDIARSLI